MTSCIFLKSLNNPAVYQAFLVFKVFYVALSVCPRNGSGRRLLGSVIILDKLKYR